MARRTDTGQLLTEVILQIFRLRGRLLVGGDALVAHTGQTSARWQLLGSVSHGPMTVADIARRTGRRRQSVQELANRLEDDGLIRYEPHPTDRRTQLAVLTDVGRAVLKDLTAIQMRWVNDLAAGLRANKLAETSRVLDALEQRLDKENP